MPEQEKGNRLIGSLPESGPDYRPIPAPFEDTLHAVVRPVKKRE